MRTAVRQRDQMGEMWIEGDVAMRLKIRALAEEELELRGN